MNESPLDENPLRAIERELPRHRCLLPTTCPFGRSAIRRSPPGKTSACSGQLAVKGKLGREVSVGEGQQASADAVLNCLSALHQHLGSLDRVVSIASLTGYAASAEGFTDQSSVMNGASVVLEEAFGERGCHARAAVGVTELRGQAPVEISLVVEV